MTPAVAAPQSHEADPVSVWAWFVARVSVKVWFAVIGSVHAFDWAVVPSEACAVVHAALVAVFGENAQVPVSVCVPLAYVVSPTVAVQPRRMQPQMLSTPQLVQSESLMK